MAESARVMSLDAIVRFRGALGTFDDEASQILVAIDRQGQRVLQWLENEAPAYWRLQVLRCHEQISRARSALDTAMMRKTKDYTPSCIEEKDALRRARARLQEAEDKTETVRRWARLVREELEEYRGRIHSLRDCVENDVPLAIALLDRTLRALESYLDRPVSESESQAANAHPPVGAPVSHTLPQPQSPGDVP